MWCAQAAPQGQDAAQQLQSVLAQAALLQQLQAHQSAHSQLMQLLQLNQLVQASSGSADAAGALLPCPVPLHSLRGLACLGSLCPHFPYRARSLDLEQGSLPCPQLDMVLPAESFSGPAGTQTAALLAQLTQAQQAPGSAAAGLNLSALLGGGSPTPSPAASLALPMGCCAPTSGPADAATPKVCSPVGAALRVSGTMDPRHTRGVACWAAACCPAPRQPPRLRQADSLVSLIWAYSVAQMAASSPAFCGPQMS